MALNTEILSRVLARNPLITNHDFWRAQRSIEDELYLCRRLGKPVPIELVYARRVIEAARARRNGQPN